MNYKEKLDKLLKWIDGDITFLDADDYIKNRVPVEKFNIKDYIDFTKLREHKNIYHIICVFSSIVFIFILLKMVNTLPKFGEIGNPVHNEVMKRYVEQGVEETGAINLVTGMILDYRAFDTFAEANLLFLALMASFILLKRDPDISFAKEERELREDEIVIRRERDSILQSGANYLCPLVLLYGIYIIINGHLSPGGGLAGGCIIGSGLVLYAMAYGKQRVQKFFNVSTFFKLNAYSLLTYFLLKSYSFFIGANQLEDIVPKGEAGNILSAGLILPLNICIGIIVTSTIYGLYALFIKGDI